MTAITTRVDLNPRTAPNLPSRLRRAIATQDAEELALLKPIIKGVARGLISVGELEALDATQAQVLLQERATRAGSTGRTSRRQVLS